MISRRSTLAGAVCSALLFFCLPIQAQPASQTPPNQSTYTLHAYTGVVLTDVTVTDKKGNPVHDLPQSAFRIVDNKQPQQIASFEEHAGTPAASVPSEGASGIYSNDYLLHLPPVLNILLIDIARLDIADQMYLHYELTKYMNERPEAQPLAIFVRAASGCFLVQNFTSDRKLLLAALHKAIPRFPPLNREQLDDFDALQQMALALGQLPGRKNVLWFSGGSFERILTPDAIPLPNNPAWRDLYDELTQERIAIYPIDARGLMVILRPEVLRRLVKQHLIMDEQAQATGGQAFYDNNGLKEATEHFLGTDTSFYTLTYSLPTVDLDNKWHKIHVEVEGHGYHLSYRTGYFADGSLHNTEQPAKPRTRLLVNGEKLEVPEPNNRPIIFEARVLRTSDPSYTKLGKPSVFLPAPPAKNGSVPFSIQYTVPIDAFTVKQVDGKHQVVFGVAVIALNRDGGAEEREAQQVTMTLKEEAFLRDPTRSITLEQQLNLPKGVKSLSLGIWDTATRRAGNIQIPLEVSKPFTPQAAGQN